MKDDLVSSITNPSA